MKIRQVGAELSHVDGRKRDRRTDMMKLIDVFRIFSNTPKKEVIN